MKIKPIYYLVGVALLVIVFTYQGGESQAIGLPGGCYELNGYVHNIQQAGDGTWIYDKSTNTAYGGQGGCSITSCSGVDVGNGLAVERTTNRKLYLCDGPNLRCVYDKDDGDAGSAQVSCQTEPSCGDNVCQSDTENCNNCAQDCGQCPVQSLTCDSDGDGMVSGQELSEGINAWSTG